jgi:hypothetical protein
MLAQGGPLRRIWRLVAAFVLKPESGKQAPLIGRAKQTRRAEGVVNRLNFPAPVLSRAVQVAAPRCSRCRRAECLRIVGVGQIHGTAQNRRGQSERAIISRARRVPPPLRLGAALVYVLIHRKPAGRDVGLAKSGFRPTARWVAKAPGKAKILASRICFSRRFGFQGF